MKISIRKFLVINLLLAITITTTLTVIGNYYLDQKDIQNHLDTLMAVSTLSYQALLSDNINKQKLDNIQVKLNNIPSEINKYYHGKFTKSGINDFSQRFNFQVWTNGEKLLLHSLSAPKYPLTSEQDGFSYKHIDNNTWRTFTTYNPKSETRIVVAEKSDSRNELGHRIALDDLYIMLLTFPLSGLLIWIIIGKALDTLDKVAKEVSNRAPTYLEPVNVENIPQEIKPVIDELNKLFFRLQQGFEREKRFAADAAHELRTPLAALKTQAQVALRTDDITERKEALNNVIEGVNRSTHITQQLLTMSRLVPDAHHLNDLSKINLPKLAAEIIANIAPYAVEKQIDIELETSQDNLMIRGNLTALSILIRNLVDNAIRYTPEGGNVLIKISHDNNNISLKVIDSGPGVPPELRNRVFERFFRVLGNKSPGSGLGLAIVQQIAKFHNATVTLDSPPSGSGLEIEVCFTIDN